MTADTYDSIIGLIQQGTGNNNNSWGTTFNTSFAAIAARAMAGINTISTTSGTVDLSTTVPPAGARLDMDKIQRATGALVGDLTVQVPNVSKTWWFENDTSNAFNMYVKVPSGVTPNGLVQIPQGCGIMVMCDGAGNLRRSDRADVGAFRISGKAAAGSGELACDGSSKLRTAFPDLFNAIGTTWGSVDGTHFTLPLLTDTNRFLRAAGGSGPAVGTYQSNQNLAHTHTVTGAPSAGTLGTASAGSHTPSGAITNGAITNTAAGANVTLVHTNGGTLTNGGGNYAFTAVDMSASYSQTASTFSGDVVAAHTHTITGAPGLGTLATASSGGTEARPESAAVLICIRY